MTDDELIRALGAIQKAFEEETENGVPPQNNVFTLDDFLESSSRQKEFSSEIKRNVTKPKWNYHQFKKGKRTK